MKRELTPPIGHSAIETEDGSITFYSEAFQEACHSTSGARTETILHYIEGCRVLEKIQTHTPLVILEVGLGLGVGFLTTLEVMPKDKKWHFVSVELDKNLLNWFKENHPELSLQWRGNVLETENENFKLTIIQGDARTSLPEYLRLNPLKWHAIFQDAFSPKKNPTLWTKEWFELLKNYSHDEVILSTYSASASIRKSLHETGWGVQKGERFGNKRTSTRANLSSSTDPEILLHLERSPVSALTDLQIIELLPK